VDERRYSFGAVGSFKWHIWMHVLLAVSVILMVSLGLGRIVALRCCSSALHQIH
jgi:hypothetical protein